MDMYYFNNEPATVKMLPVCECGYIFRDGICVTQDIIGAKGYRHGIYHIEPPCCPNCKRRIETVSMEMI